MIMADLPEPAEEDEAMLLSWATTRRRAKTAVALAVVGDFLLPALRLLAGSICPCSNNSVVASAAAALLPATYQEPARSEHPGLESERPMTSRSR